MNVLSLFDGMSCGQIALDQVGIKVDNYFAAEIDKWAMQVAKDNYPNMQHLGDVTELKGTDLPKIDLLIGGSPCQGFSFAGKQLNFNDPRSALFFEFVRLLKETKPKYFMLENVRMKQEFQDIISDHLGVKPIMINSSLLSAQNRVRFYWTNIPNVTQPEDKDIVLKDVLEDVFVEPMNDEQIESAKKNCQAKKFKTGNSRGPMSFYRDVQKKSLCLVTSCGSVTNRTSNRIQVESIQKVLIANPSATKKEKSYALTASYSGAVAWNSIQRKQRTMVPVCQSEETDPNIVDGYYYRKLTPVECERLQTVPDNYTEGVSNTQRYKMLGNGWTVDVIAHILKGMNIDTLGK